MSQLPYCVQYVQALGPTVVAVVAALFALYIGLRQWRTAHYRLSLDMFEKRFAVYKAVKDFVFKASWGSPTRGDFQAFAVGVRGAEFFFDGKTRDLIIKIGDMVFRAHITREQLDQHPDHPQAQNLIKEEEEISKYLLELQGKALEDMFRRYLDLSKVGLT